MDRMGFLKTVLLLTYYTLAKSPIIEFDAIGSSEKYQNVTEERRTTYPEVTERRGENRWTARSRTWGSPT